MKTQENGLLVGYEAVVDQQRKLTMETISEIKCRAVKDSLTVAFEQQEINRFLKIASQI